MVSCGGPHSQRIHCPSQRHSLVLPPPRPSTNPPSDTSHCPLTFNQTTPPAEGGRVGLGGVRVQATERAEGFGAGRKGARPKTWRRKAPQKQRPCVCGGWWWCVDERVVWTKMGEALGGRDWPASCWRSFLRICSSPSFSLPA